MYKQNIANQIYDQMMQHFYCEEGLLVEAVIETRDYNLAQHYGFVDRMSLYAQYTENIRSILSDEIKKRK
jgi:type III restriction enzyme